jgi:hypothetical protein
MKPAITAFVLSLLATAASAAGESPSAAAPAGDLQAEFTMRMFMQLCMTTGGERTLVAAEADKLGFRKLAPEAASRFAGSNGGEAWGVQVTGGFFALALDTTGVCTVYARRLDADAFRRTVTSWLPPSSAGFETEAGPSTTGADGLKTTVYQIRRGGRPFAAWVVSASAAEDAFFQGAVSMRRAR